MFQGKKDHWINLCRQFYQHSNTDILKQLYISSVRPHLEYAAAVWGPHLQKDINKLRKVQTFALGMCTKSWTADYNSLLTTCNLPSLKKRRLFSNLVFFIRNFIIAIQQHNRSDISIRSGPSSGFDKNLYINVDKHKSSYLLLNSVHDCVFGRLEGVGRLDGV